MGSFNTPDWPAGWPRLEELREGVAEMVLLPVSAPTGAEASTLPHLSSGHSWKLAMADPAKKFLECVVSESMYF